ncbi:MAG TPA: cysteine desulfurase NifS [Roseiflexaceae bacterium]|nr:cysteine desulfurase NifS [Roseiflexaceae bacterium]HMP40044.1 cysteine desulfurase NifS [Roseiflexaceae bacterium]
MTERLIYLDHAATTPLDEQVLDAMLPYLRQQYGNPSSIHRIGRAALDALDGARETVATVLGTSPKEIVFTGSGSEANNLAIKGVAQAQRRAGRGSHIITSAIEHHAVLHPAESLAREGFELTVLPVDAQGCIRPADLQAALRPDTVLVSVMYANNEIGTIQPIAELGAICRANNIPLHTDAVQAAGSLPLDVAALQVDLLTITAHKFYGPKGVGALYIRRGVAIAAQIEGGGQERRRRAGTENVAGAVGLASALQLAEARRSSYAAHCSALRDRLISGILARVPDAWLNGHPTERLPNNVNLGFAGIEGESILLLLDQHGIAASSGSACSAGSLEASHVLLALGLPEERAIGSLRLTVGQSTTAAEIDTVIDALPAVIERLRAFSPSYRISNTTPQYA